MLEALFSFKPKEQPKANEVDYKSNPTKLFKRVESRAWQAAIEQLNANPIEAQIWNYKTSLDGSINWKRLPIHEACMRKPSPKMIHSLLKFHASGVSEKDNKGRLPLHYACDCSAPLKVIELLLTSFPEAIEVKDYFNQTPLKIVMSQYFPDPHVIAALKKGVAFYENQPALVRSPSSSSIHRTNSASSNAGMSVSGMQNNNHNFTTTERSIPRGLPPAPPPPPEAPAAPIRTSLPPPIQTNYSGITRKTATSSLEGEIGRFSEQLARNVDREKGMQSIIRSLENEVNRLRNVDDANFRLQAELRELENALRVSSEANERTRQENMHQTKALAELRGADIELKSRGLEDTINNLQFQLQDTESRYEREIQTHEHQKEMMKQDAEKEKMNVRRLEDEKNKMQLELQKVQFEKSSSDEIIKTMREKIIEMGEMKRQMSRIEHDKRDQEKDFRLADEEVRRLSQKLDSMDLENKRLREERLNITRINDKAHAATQEKMSEIYELRRLRDRIQHEQKIQEKAFLEISIKLDEVESENRRLMEERDSSSRLHDEIENQACYIHELESKLNQRNEDIEKLEEEISYISHLRSIDEESRLIATKEMTRLSKENTALKETIESGTKLISDTQESSKKEKELLKAEIEIEKQNTEKMSKMYKHIEEELSVTKKALSFGSQAKSEDVLRSDICELKQSQLETKRQLQVAIAEKAKLELLVENLKSNKPNSDSLGNNSRNESLVNTQEKLRHLQTENEMLRAMLEEEHGDESVDSIDELEQRLAALEMTKDAEIAVLVEEREELNNEISKLNEKIASLEKEIKQLKEDHATRSAAIETLKARRDRKKKTIEERLRNYENRAQAGSVVSTDRLIPKMDQDDNVSILSGASFRSSATSSSVLHTTATELSTTRTKPRDLFLSPQNSVSSFGKGISEEHRDDTSS